MLVFDIVFETEMGIPNLNPSLLVGSTSKVGCLVCQTLNTSSLLYHSQFLP
ncbi:hypothetical protein O9929_10785 [Vibrio lentus]|nr:hypothetical protein [Vibrio lentus]